MMKAQYTEERVEDHTDGALGLAIIGVVCVTVLGRINDAGFLQDGRIAHLLVLLQFIVSAFAYPCLFFLCGLKAADALGRATSRWGFVKTMLATLVYPYLLWSLLQMGVQWFIAQQANHPFPLTDFDRAAWAPVDQLWFLYALCVCQLIACFTLWRAARERGGVVSVAGSVVLAVFAVICATLATRTDWGIVTLTLWGLTFFLLGMLLGPRFSAWIVRAARIPVVIVALVVFAVTIRLAQSLGGYLNASTLPGTCFAIVAALLLAQLLGDRWNVRWLSTLGAAWMPVYLLHVLVTALVWHALLAASFTAAVVQFFVGVVVGVIVPVAVYRFTKRARMAGLVGFGHAELPPRTDAQQQAQLARYDGRVGIDQPHG
ncbi:acyltransferase [Paraburkholderia sp. DHOC27]|uniref:acyltransferase family protein n=1 Tax=Paraburkholderia sp. DHOC27 TaxID=2303330 RepID=UPI0015F33961|nr:acyltransferase [Paraburkholderia sp. DHOC27]